MEPRVLMRPEERLIVAVDLTIPPTEASPYRWLEKEILNFADSVADTGIYLKLNSALRALGYGIIFQLKSRGLKTFADLKLYDIPQTLSLDGQLLQEAAPELVTTVCAAGSESMRMLKTHLKDSEVLGVTVLTNLDDIETGILYSCPVRTGVMRFAEVANQSGIDGLICSPAEVEMLRRQFGLRFSLNTPAIRPKWAVVKGDDQNKNRSMTPAEAISVGATRIVVGRPILTAQNPREAVLRTIEEINLGTRS